MTIIRRLWQRLVRMRPLYSGLLIFVVALAVRLAFLIVFHTYQDLSRVELERTAISLVKTGVYGNPYAVPTGPSAHVAPGYTLILAAIYKVFGMGITGEVVKRGVASLVSSLIWAVLPAVSRLMLGSTAPGVLAGFVTALYPARPLVEIEGDWETPYTALALIVISILSYLLWTRRDVRPKVAVWHGFAWGVCLLFVPALLDIFFCFVAVGIYFCRKQGLGRYLAFASVEVAIAAACLAPWVIRNDRVLGTPVVTRTNLGLELRISNNDEASPDQRVNFLNGLFDRYHPLLSKPDAIKVREMGEVAYNKWAAEQATEWAHMHPRRFFELCLGRVRCYWFYNDPTSRIKTLLLAVTTALGFVGFFYLIRRKQIVPATIFALMLVLYPLPNYLVHVGLRQEFPLHWLMSLLAALAVLTWFSRTSTATTGDTEKAARA